MRLSPEKTLRYLSSYMEEWIDLWPAKPKPFNSWLDSKIDKKISVGKHNARDRFKNVCRYCGRHFDEVEKTRDHVIPISFGGLDKKDNRVFACKECNSWKDDKSLVTWLKELRKLVKNEHKIKHPYNKTLVGTMIGRIKSLIEQIDESDSKVSTYKHKGR